MEKNRRGVASARVVLGTLMAMAAGGQMSRNAIALDAPKPSRARQSAKRYSPRMSVKQKAVRQRPQRRRTPAQRYHDVGRRR